MRLAVLLLLSGCATLRPARPDYVRVVAASSPERCASLSRKSEVEHILAILFAGIGSAGAGVAGAVGDNAVARYSVLGAAGVLGLAGAVLSYTGGVASAAYTHECP